MNAIIKPHHLRQFVDSYGFRIFAFVDVLHQFFGRMEPFTLNFIFGESPMKKCLVAPIALDNGQYFHRTLNGGSKCIISFNNPGAITDFDIAIGYISDKIDAIQAGHFFAIQSRIASSMAIWMLPFFIPRRSATAARKSRSSWSSMTKFSLAIFEFIYVYVYLNLFKLYVYALKRKVYKHKSAYT